jgi:glycosyltransferase involved in cell wall biosynthesis
LLEAAAAAAPIIATNVGGTPEIFPSNRNAARLISPSSTEELAAAILQLLEDPAERLRLGAAARRRAEETFDANVAANSLANHYREVLAEGHAV